MTWLTIIITFFSTLWIFTGCWNFLSLESKWFKYNHINYGVKYARHHEMTISQTTALLFIAGVAGPIMIYINYKFSPR